MNKPNKQTPLPNPFELLKTAGDQIAGVDIKPEEASEAEKPAIDPELEEKLNLQKTRRLQALEQEITEIRNLRNQKPQEGAPLAEAPTPLIQPTAKPDRKFAGEGLGAKRQQTHVEKPLPPSG